MIRRRQRRAAVVRVDVARPLETLEIDDSYDEALLIVSLHGRVFGQIFVDATRPITAEEQWRRIAAEFGSAVMGALVRERVARARGTAAADRDLQAAVVVCTRRRADQLEDCLASIAELTTRPAEVIVVDNTEGDGETVAACERHGARHVVEPAPGQTRARNRGLLETDAEIVAFTDDDCRVDSGWLDGLAEAFADPMVMCVTGYIGPLELETPAQYLFERHGGFQRNPRRTVYDLRRLPPLRGAAVAGAGANMIFRRRIFSKLGNFAEDLGPGTPARSSDDKYQFYRVLAAGYRIAYEPDRIVWHRHRRELSELRSIFNDYGVAEFAYTTRCLLEHRDPSALYIWWWWLRHIATDAVKAVGPGRRDVPLIFALEELRGALAGPGALRKSAASRAGIPPLPPPPDSGPSRSGAPRVASELPAVSVAIATFNGRAGLRPVLEALAEQDLPREDYEVVTVVDGSTDGTAEMVRALDVPYPLRVIEQPNSGLAATRNRGAREARHPVVMFLDDDIRPVPQAVRAHATAHAAAPEPHYALGYYPPALVGESLWAASLRLWWEDHFRRKADPTHQWTFVDVVDGNSSIHVEQFLDLGGFDERYRGGRRQDYEFGVRLLDQEVPLAFHRDAKGLHHFDPSLETAVENAREEGRYDVLLATMHPAVKGRLPLATFARRLQRPRLAALSQNAVTARLRPEGALSTLRALERLRLRGQWHRLLDQMLLHAYALGAMEATGSWAALHEFLADIVVEARSASDGVRLESPGHFAMPDTHRPLDLQLRYHERPVTAIEAMHPNHQWDWETVLQCVEDEAVAPMALRLAVDAFASDEAS